MPNESQDNGEGIPKLFSQTPEKLIANVEALYERYKDDPQLLKSVLRAAGMYPELQSQLPADLRRKIGVTEQLESKHQRSLREVAKEAVIRLGHTAKHQVASVAQKVFKHGQGT